MAKVNLPQWALDYIERRYYRELGDEWENQLRAYFGLPLLPTRDAVLGPPPPAPERQP